MLKSHRVLSTVSPLTLALLCGAAWGSNGCSGSDSDTTPSDTSGGDDDSGSAKDAGKKKDSGKVSTSPGTDSGDDDSDDASGDDDASGGGTDEAGGGSGKDAGGSGGGTDGGTVGGDAGGGSSSGTSPAAQYLPTVSGTCPSLATGTVTVSGQQVQIWAGSAAAAKNGSLVMYWHGTGESSANATAFFGQAQISAVTAAGGVVAAFNSSTKQGTSTAGPDTVFYTGDFPIADQVVACAIKQFHIDSRKIYVLGDSAGGLQAVAMYYARSGYLAAVATNSGGLVTGLNGGTLQDPSNVPPAMAIHGSVASDTVIINFADASVTWEKDVKSRGGFSIDCNTQGGHDSGPPATGVAMWQFFKDHPFKTKPEPYAGGLPSSFPSYCHVGPRSSDGGI